VNKVNPELKRQLRTMKVWLDDNKSRYEDAVTDLMANAKQFYGKVRLLQLWASQGYKKGDQPHDAVYMMGHMQARLDNALEPYIFIGLYETNKAEFEQLIEDAQREAEGTSAPLMQP
jgi:hypothetical protein